MSEFSPPQYHELIICPPDLETFLTEEIDALKYDLALDTTFMGEWEEGRIVANSASRIFATMTHKRSERVESVLADMECVRDLLIQGDIRPALNVLEQKIKALEQCVADRRKAGRNNEADEIQIELNTLQILYNDQLESSP